jgi:putative flavoprotein involved in K+ transport
MTEHVNVVIIGAGQAGLATSYYLTQLKRNHIILEQASEITPAWRDRWDSFTLVLPNWTIQMPGSPYQGDDPNGFMDRDDLIAFMERYAASFEPQIRFGIKVTSVEKNPSGDNFLVNAGGETIEADNVVVGAGTFQAPKIPSFGQNIAKEFTQIHTSDYRNPQTLPDGAVLVVGTGQSGCQIAEELYQSGRQVYLSVGGANPVPRRYRGKDVIWWLGKMGFFDHTVANLPSSKARFGANPYVSGANGGHSLNLHQFARDGVVLLGRLVDAQASKISLAPDLHENLAKSDQFIVELKQGIDKFIEERQMEVEEASKPAEMRDGFAVEIHRELDLAGEGIQSIIWATGYRFDFSWVKFPLLDQDGYPIHVRGISAFPGLYFVGLHWLHNRKSGLLWGVGEDAAYVAADIARRP